MIGVTILISYYGIIGISGVLLNATLLWLSIFKSPAQIKMYRILIVNFAITDMAGSFFIMFVTPRIIPLDFAMAHMFYGVCHYVGKTSCYAAYSFTLHLFMHSMWSLLLSFCYRYYILISGPPSVFKLVFCITCIYIPSFLQFIVFMFTAGDPQELFDILKSKFPTYEVDYSTVTGMTDVLSPAVTFTIINMTFPIFPIYTAILVFRRKILQKLEANAAHFRSETRSIHRQLLKALTLQACLPTLFIIGATLFIILEARLTSSPILECLIFAIPAPIPLFSCLISIYHIRPYRQALLHTLLRVNIPAVPKEHHSSATALAPQHKVSVLSLSRIRLHRLSIPNNS